MPKTADVENIEDTTEEETSSIGKVVGTVLVALVVAGASAAVYRWKKSREVEDVVPDHVPDELVEEQKS